MSLYSLITHFTSLFFHIIIITIIIIIIIIITGANKNYKNWIEKRGNY
jgi:hypothetical protein